MTERSSPNPKQDQSESASSNTAATANGIAYGAQSVLLQPPPKWTRILIWSLGLGTVSLLTWSWFTRIDETVSMDGQIETASPEAKIISANEGVLEQVYIHPHQSVQRGDLLFRLSAKDIDSTISGLRIKYIKLQRQRTIENILYRSKLEQLQIQATLHRSIINKLSKLAAAGAAQEMQVLERRSSLQETINAMQTLKQELVKSDNTLDIQQVETKSDIQELLNKREDMVIRAPVSGTIQDMRYNTAGERVQQGEELATIVPQLQLLAAVSVPSRVSAPVTQGHQARMSVDAFPSNEYGELKGKIISVSPNTDTETAKDNVESSNYKAKIAINRQQVPKRFPLNQLRPGMAVKAKVKLRERAVITLVFDFLEKLTAPLTQRR